MRSLVMTIAVAIGAGGCAARGVHVAKPTEHFWQTCIETAPLQPDSFQHFICSNTKGKRWEVLVRPEPSK